MIEFKNITKKFGSFTALDQVTFSIQPQSIHALVGENGAGKSTLMKVLVGLEKPTTGEMFLHHQAYTPENVLASVQKKIGLVHQHFQLADELTGLEHLFLVADVIQLSRKKALQKAQTLLAQFNWIIPLKQKIKTYSVGEQQRLEILRVLLAEPEIIVFDEPTAVLSPVEVAEFLIFLKKLKSSGRTIILISHKLHEIKSVADTVTILCRGQQITTAANTDLSIDKMAELMIGRPQKKLEHFLISKEKNPVLQVNEITFYDSEILGVAGVDGNGQDELIQDFIKQLKAQKKEFADISEDRYRYGIYPNMNLCENFLMKYRHSLSQRWGFIKKDQVKDDVETIIKHWDVRPPEALKSAGQFSGGNQQKFVIGRELFFNPSFILAAHPTRGVDLGAQEKIHQELINRAEQKATILLVSADLDEILALSHRLIVLFKGQIFGPFQKNELSLQQISLLMNGVKYESSL